MLDLPAALAALGLAFLIIAGVCVFAALAYYLSEGRSSPVPVIAAGLASALLGAFLLGGYGAYLPS